MKNILKKIKSFYPKERWTDAQNYYKEILSIFDGDRNDDWDGYLQLLELYTQANANRQEAIKEAMAQLIRDSKNWAAVANIIHLAYTLRIRKNVGTEIKQLNLSKIPSDWQDVIKRQKDTYVAYMHTEGVMIVPIKISRKHVDIPNIEFFQAQVLMKEDGYRPLCRVRYCVTDNNSDSDLGLRLDLDKAVFLDQPEVRYKITPEIKRALKDLAAKITAEIGSMLNR